MELELLYYCNSYVLIYSCLEKYCASCCTFDIWPLRSKAIKSWRVLKYYLLSISYRYILFVPIYGVMDKNPLTYGHCDKASYRGSPTLKMLKTWKSSKNPGTLWLQMYSFWSVHEHVTSKFGSNVVITVVKLSKQF